MKKFFMLAVVMMVMALTFGNAFAAVFPHADAKVEITVPDTWKVEPKEDTLVAQTPTGDVAISFSIVAGEAMEAAVDAATKEVAKQFGELKTVSTTEVEINGMKSFIEDSTTADGKMSVSLALIHTPANKFMLVFYAAEAEAEKKYEKEITSVIQGIKPLAEKK